MSLADQLENAKAAARPNAGCAVGRLLQTLNEGDADALRQAMDDGVESSAIGRELQAEGHRVAPQTVSRHRRGECRCDVAGLS